LETPVGAAVSFVCPPDKWLSDDRDDFDE